MTRAVVLGGSGFVGREVAAALGRRGAEVALVAAPRLTTSARDLASLRRDLTSAAVQAEVDRLRGLLAHQDVVVNAAGVAVATGQGDDLFGANALLPTVAARAAPATARFIHVSSAAVQGRRAVLDESEDHQWFSPYSTSKGLGELLLHGERPGSVSYRPTSVHGHNRSVTARLARLLSGPASSVAGRGNAPTPQVLVANVGDAAAFLALTSESPPPVVLHPWEGMTTAELARVLGGREPRHVPQPLARALVATCSAMGRLNGRVAGEARRLEMLWFGQYQSPGWLDGRWSPPVGSDAWKDMV